jgi:hypothetical protein
MNPPCKGRVFYSVPVFNSRIGLGRLLFLYQNLNWPGLAADLFCVSFVGIS